MLRNRLYLFTPASVPGIITPEQTRLINESSGLFDTVSKDTPWTSGKEENVSEKTEGNRKRYRHHFTIQYVQSWPDKKRCIMGYPRATLLPVTHIVISVRSTTAAYSIFCLNHSS